MDNKLRFWPALLLALCVATGCLADGHLVPVVSEDGYDLLDARITALENATPTPPDCPECPACPTCPDPDPDPDPDPEPPEDPAPEDPNRKFGSNIGFYWEKEWSPDKPDDPRYSPLLAPIAEGLRFMDYQRINDRLFNNFNESELSEMVRIAIETNAEFFWLNVFYYDSYDTVRAKVRYVRERLPHVVIIVEWANEAWVGTTNVYREVVKNSGGATLGEPAFFDEWALRANAAHRAAKDEDESVVLVLGAQAANKWIAQQMQARLNPPVEAHGITFYFRSGLDFTRAANYTVDEILASAADEARQRDIPKIVEHIEYSRGIGKIVLGYEGGPELFVPGQFHATHKTTAANMNQANRDPRIVEIMSRVTEAWDDAGGGLMFGYTYLSLYDIWGSWGAGESLDTIEQAPKYLFYKGDQ